MKKLLIIALAIASANAFASRARMTALGNAAHLIDTQTVYTNPSDINLLGDYVTFEAGLTDVDPGAPNCNPDAGGVMQSTCSVQGSNAEGMIVRSFGDMKLGLSLGVESKNATTWEKALRSEVMTGVAGIMPQQNPIGLFYATNFGDISFGATLVYSNYNNKTADEKESSNGIRLGMRTGAWDARLGIGLTNKYETATVDYKGTAGYSAAVGYTINENNYVHVGAEMAGFEVERTAPAPLAAEDRELDYTKFNVGYVHSHKTDGQEFFYTVGLAQDKIDLKLKTSDNSIEVTSLVLPISVGIEVDAASWMVLRGSVTQNTILNNSEAKGYPAPITYKNSEMAPGLNSTVAAIGAGLKFNNLMIDGTLEGLTGSTASQGVNGDNLLTSVAVTYKF